MSTNKKELTIEECREAALKYFETLKSYAKQRVEMNPQEIISDLRDFTLHYLDINQIASLESVLQNAVRDLRFGARKRSAVNHYHESAQVILVPGNFSDHSFSIIDKILYSPGRRTSSHLFSASEYSL